MAVPVIEILCILVDNKFKHALWYAFIVEVLSNGNMAHFRKKIKEERQIDLAHVDAARLEVWKLHDPREPSEIIQSIPNLRCSAGALLEGETEVARLVPGNTQILSQLSGIPDDKVSVLVHVSVPGGTPDSINRGCSIYLLTRAYRDWRTTLPDDAGVAVLSDLVKAYGDTFIKVNDWQTFQETDIGLNYMSHQEDRHPAPDFVKKFEQMLDRKPGLRPEAVRSVNLAATYFETREDSTVEDESHEPLRYADELEALHIAHVASYEWQTLWRAGTRTLKEFLAYGMFFSQLLCIPKDTMTKVHK